jgi:hypothetical protein
VLDGVGERGVRMSTMRLVWILVRVWIVQTHRSFKRRKSGCRFERSVKEGAETSRTNIEAPIQSTSTVSSPTVTVADTGGRCGRLTHVGHARVSSTKPELEAVSQRPGSGTLVTYNSIQLDRTNQLHPSQRTANQLGYLTTSITALLQLQ